MNYYKVTISDNTGSMYLMLLGSSTKEVEEFVMKTLKEGNIDTSKIKVDIKLAIPKKDLEKAVKN